MDETLTQETNRLAIKSFCEQNNNFEEEEILRIEDDPFIKNKVVLK